MGDVNQVRETLRLLKEAQKGSFTPNSEVAKAGGWSQSGSATTGITFYDLESPAKTLYPVLTPLRNRIARVVGGKGIQANWKAITGINTTNVRLGVSEGNRGGIATHSVADYNAVFKGFGLEDFATFEGDYAARGFDDVKARAVEGLLRATMIQEEQVDVGGNTSLQFGTTPTPTLAQNADTTSTVSNGALSVICVALGYAAYQALAGLNNGFTNATLGLTIDPNSIAIITRQQAGIGGGSDTFGGGVGQKSVNATVTIDAAHKSCAAYVTPVNGAFGYAWYWGAQGTEYLGAITTTNGLQIAANASTTVVVGSNLATDNSTCNLECDGLLTQALKANSGAYIAYQPTGVPGTGTKLTSNGAGGIVEIDNMCLDRWNRYRLSMDTLWVNAQELMNINNIIVKNGGAPLIRFEMTGAGGLIAGIQIESILNRVTGQKIALHVHPNIPAGTTMAECAELPYKLSGVTDPVRMLLRQDYYQIQWPQMQRKYEFGCYFDGVLQHYFPPAIGIIANIPNAS